MRKVSGSNPDEPTMKTENIEQYNQFKEEESSKTAEESFEPRREYREGILPLKFEYKFDDGKKLIAEEKKGIAKIVLKKDNKVIFNLSDLLPKDYKFVTPAFARNTKDEYLKQQCEEGSIWATDADKKSVLIGDWRDPRDIITLLHEIGHANQKTERIKVLEKMLEMPANTGLGIEDYFVNATKARMKTIRKAVSENSKLEREAWAYALNKFREIQKEKDIDLKSLFPNLVSLKTFIYPCLKSYRVHYEMWGNIVGSLLNTIPEIREENEKLQKDLLNYFDKQKDFDRPPKSI
jgi:hypothetical protein